ncbi:hypothetical protein LRM40_17520 [Ideonella dechloratans]|uniref:hypothetical protein n=1 Tax=Ideonella dechloratans TaxID=36863 RepID=UPI001B87BDEA|nr:hypothetical protein [Ideonella dechloratans]UFU10072.1 hypothetical protein LRM40_17520 [Ideonella dechloratans]
MAKGDPIGANEEVVRAYRYPYWDAAVNRGTPSAFTEAEVSVSRLAILDFEKIVAIFKTDFDGRIHPDGSSMQLRGTGRAIVADIVRQAEVPADPKSKELPNVVLTVNEDKIENEPGITDNPAHALIRGWERANQTQARRIPRSVAKRLLDLFGAAAIPDDAPGNAVAAGGDASPA